MKKHIKKKFLDEHQLNENVIDVMKKSLNGYSMNDNLNKIKIPKDYVPILVTDTNVMFRAFEYKYQGEVSFVPEPDPILIYFHTAYMNFRIVSTKKNELLKKLTQKGIMNEILINDLYDFFGATCSFVILLFTAIETLINRNIPKDYIYKKPFKKKTEIYSKRQIEMYLSFDEKLKKALVDATKKDFSKQYNLKYQHIVNLKEYRDLIVHTKEDEEKPTYDYLYKKALSFKYDETLDAVKDFCNFYSKTDFIEECNCSNDW